MNIKERISRWFLKRKLMAQLNSFYYFGDIEGAHEVLHEMKLKGFFEKKRGEKMN